MSWWGFGRGNTSCPTAEHCTTLVGLRSPTKILRDLDPPYLHHATRHFALSSRRRYSTSAASGWEYIADRRTESGVATPSRRNSAR